MRPNESTPAVLIIAFKRPESTKRVFEAVRAARPTHLFVATDGPREGRPEEIRLCAEVRDVLSRVDWSCEVRTKFRDANVGIKTNVSEAISWFLEIAGQGIILEDDCLPSSQFFSYCSELLERYRTNERIYQISGSSFVPIQRPGESYFYSKYNHCWGWATWNRAWKNVDLEMATYPQIGEGEADIEWDSPKERKYWHRIFTEQKQGKIDTWDYQWKYTLWKNRALCVYPFANMVSNLGFNEAGTNTKQDDSDKSERPFGKPLVDSAKGLIAPQEIQRDVPLDRWTFRHLYWGTPLKRFSARVSKLWTQWTKRA